MFVQLSRTQAGRKVFIPVSRRPSCSFSLLPAHEVEEKAQFQGLTYISKSLISLDQRCFQRHFHILLQGRMGRDGRMGKIRYRNVKRNYEVLITIGNRKCWVPVSLGNMKQVFGLSVNLALSLVASSAHSSLLCGD